MNSDVSRAAAIAADPTLGRVAPVALNGEAAGAASSPPMDRNYSLYALSVLVLVNVFVLMDRQVLGVLAEDIKADLGISDADIGFIYGTALSVFYAIFSIPFGRLADVWTRKNLLAASVGAWSAMIVLTGSARNIGAFAVFRAGVGVGEAGAGPAALSMIADYFPSRLRSTAMSVFSAGVPIGAGLGLFVGGFVLNAWGAAYPDPALAPFGLTGWQAAFICIATPGPFLALWLFTLREPVRGQSEGLATTPHAHPFREAWGEMQAVLPVVSVFLIRRLGGDLRAIGLNAALGLMIALISWTLIEITGSAAQWIAIGVGAYCLAGWIQALALRDPATFEMIFRCRSLLLTNMGLAAYVFVVAGVGAWVAPFLIRVHQVSPLEAGVALGILTSGGGIVGTLVGGVLSDALERHTPRARLYVLLGSLALAAPSIVAMLFTASKHQAYLFIGLFYLTSTAWYGIGPAIANSLVMPRMRGVSSAFYLIMITLFGIALGPYMMGYLSDLFIAAGADPGSGLRQGILLSLLVFIVTAVMLILATLNLARDTDSRLTRAKALGELI
ncbi:MAG: MFS transporter [Phenylobacterium sp.]|uniref:MFS transporter n=1 Tax=Phenylobacterium sp. TaxID=1871053 RepID=UPI002736EA9B|nr:MFS transporter [Phenylobacterium sp.]MDP3746678.1 MFS transporter [Phenylobacterium sp.]